MRQKCILGHIWVSVSVILIILLFCILFSFSTITTFWQTLSTQPRTEILGCLLVVFPFGSEGGWGIRHISIQMYYVFSDCKDYQTSSTQIPSNPKRPWKKIPQRVRGFHQTRPRETQSCRGVTLFQPTCSGTCSRGQSRILHRISGNNYFHSLIESLPTHHQSERVVIEPIFQVRAGALAASDVGDGWQNCLVNAVVQFLKFPLHLNYWLK